jgi:hypothetical protein
MTEGRECARIMGGALGELDPLCERRWEREYGDRLRGRVWCVGRVSNGEGDEGSV